MSIVMSETLKEKYLPKQLYTQREKEKYLQFICNFLQFTQKRNETFLPRREQRKSTLKIQWILIFYICIICFKTKFEKKKKNEIKEAKLYIKMANE